MADGIRIELRGSESAEAALHETARRAAHPQGLYEQVGAALVVSTQNRFETGRDPQGNPWPPSLRVLAQGGRTLMDTLALYGSITFEASDAGVAVGTNLIYAAIQQLGGTIRPVSAERLAFNIGGQKVFAQQVTIPARPFLGLDDDDAAEISALAAEWLTVEQQETVDVRS